MVETEIELKIKCLISKNGGEFTSKNFMELYSEHGIKRQFSIANKPQQNRFFKWKNKTVQKWLEPC
jgi:transposase InsO family protein